VGSKAGMEAMPKRKVLASVKNQTPIHRARSLVIISIELFRFHYNTILEAKETKTGTSERIKIYY